MDILVLFSLPSLPPCLSFHASLSSAPLRFFFQLLHFASEDSFCLFSIPAQSLFFLSVPCLVLRRLSSLIGVSLRLLSSSACPTLHPPILIFPSPPPTSLSSASLAEKDRHQTDCLLPVSIKLPHVCLCISVWQDLCVFLLPSFLYSMFLLSCLLLYS